MSTSALNPHSVWLKVRHSKRWIIVLLALIAYAFSVWMVLNAEQVSEFPKAVTDSFKFEEGVNAAEDWLKDHLRWFTRMIAGQIGHALYFVEDFLIQSPWLFVLMLIVLPSLYYGGLPLAILAIVGGLFWGAVGMWEETMETLALMGLAVILSIITGVLLGVVSSQNDRFEAFLRPVLDTMQTMPAFVYLLPAVFFFGIGGPPAILATMIYALPPVIRLTNLGIRQISLETMEAAHSFGATRLQILFKIQIPISMPSIMLGINQTIMMALGLVILSTFIGAAGLGTEVWKAIYKLKVGWSLEAGLCIVFLAIVFDRLSMAMGKPRAGLLPTNTFRFHLLPQSLDIRPWAIFIEKIIGKFWDTVAIVMAMAVGLLARGVGSVLSIVAGKHWGHQACSAINSGRFLFGSVILLAAILIYDTVGPGIGEFPDSMSISFREPVDRTVAWLSAHPVFIAFTKGLRAVIYLGFLDPLNSYLTYLPWYIIIAILGAASWISVGRNFGIACITLLFFIGACDLWTEAMLTLSSVLVSVFICFVFGFPLGVVAAHNKRFDMFLRPILDAMQTLPSFVYLIPVLMFFGGNIVSAVIATVIYALPPIIRLVTLGISQISVTYSEVASSFGATSMQTLKKVKFPMALPSIMLGLNQAVMMALAMQVVTPLIGGAGLGRDVFNALNTSNTGYGLSAGIGIVMLAIILDRISQAWTQNQKKALGL